MKYKSLVIDSTNKLIFGTAPYPVTTPRGLIIGGGHVYPEINFIIPPMEVTEKVIAELISYYKGIVSEILEHALHLYSEGIIIEFEPLIEMTRFPEIGIQLVKSDSYYDPQAFILAPENVITISAEIVKGENYVDATLRGCKKGLEIIENAQKEGLLKRDEKEDIWMENLKAELYTIPDSEDKFIEDMLPTIDRNKIILSEYGL